MANRVFPANSLNLDGIPLTSTGVRPIQSPKLILNNRAPTPADANKSYPMGTIWVVLNRAAASPDNYEFWYLADNQSIPGALWLRFAVSPTGKFISQILTTNDGDICLPAGPNNQVKFSGVSGIDVLTPVNLGDTITFGLSGEVATVYDANTGSATPALGILNIFGDTTTTTTTGSGNTITISAGGTVATSYPCNIGTAIPSGGVLDVLGVNVIQTTGVTDTIAIDLINGTDGQVLIGGGSDPLWENITSLDSSVTITNGPNSIDLSVTGAGGRGIKETIFTTSGTWTKDAGGPKYIKVIGWNGGAGGGCGQALGGGLAAAGGGGGGAGGAFIYEGPASYFAATETVTIGAGGIGVTGTNIDGGGIPGGSGGITKFGFIFSPTAAVGGNCANGFGTPGTGGTSGKIYTYALTTGIQTGVVGGSGSGGTPSAPSNMGGPTNTFLMASPGGGGAGSNTVGPGGGYTGGVGGSFVAIDGTTVIISGGAGGITPNGNGSPGNVPTTSMFITGGTGGGGGAGTNVLNSQGGNGGNGAVPGGGGGGGSGLVSSTLGVGVPTAGSGGNGGNGMVIVFEYF